MNRKLGHLLATLRREVIRHYRKRLVSIVVFGSVGRGVSTHESDVDVLIVAQRLPKGRMARVRDFDAVEESIAREMRKAGRRQAGYAISPVFKTKDEVEQGSPLFLDFVEDGVILFDRGGFFNGYLAKLRARLEKLGAKRIVQGERWYWILKPDYKPGEVFEI